MTLPIRSILFVPGDSEKKLAKAESIGADALVLDLEDAVSPHRKELARDLVAQYLRSHLPKKRTSQIWVRVNPLESGMVLNDLAAIVDASPDGVMQPKINGPADVAKLSCFLDALEVRGGVEAGSIKILPVTTETAVAPFNLGEFATIELQRLVGITWGAEDLSAAVGASTNLDANGEWAFTYKMARSLSLLAAHASGVQAIDTLYSNYKDEEGLRNSCRASRAEGFTGRIAIHPEQVAPINECFTPSMEEISHAQRVLGAFAANPGAGTVGLDGRMLDIPHKNQAELVIAQANAFGVKA